MIPKRCHIFDLRSDRFAVYLINEDSMECTSEKIIDQNNIDESDWLNSVSQFLGQTEVSTKLPAFVVIPNKWLLYRVFKTPVVDDNKQREILEYEVQQGFPHGDSELVWSGFEITQDAVEKSHLVAAIRSETMEGLNQAFLNLGLELQGAIPSFFLSLSLKKRTLSESLKTGLSCFVSIEKRHGVTLALSENSGFARTFRLKQEVFAADADLKPLQNELRKTMVAVKRQLGVSHGSSIHLTTNYEDVSDALTEAVVDSISGNHESSIDTSSYSIEFWFSQAGELKPSSLLKLPVSEAESVDKNRNALLYIGFIILGIAPFLLVAGNQRVINSYKLAIQESRNEAAVGRANQQTFDSLSDSISETLSSLEEGQRLETQRSAWIRLFVDLQDALQTVTDTWFESMEVVLENGENNGVVQLQLSGSFLVRQSNLRDEVKQQAIRDAEQSLQTLKELLLKSSFIEKLVEFKVNYSGIDRGVNVVPFSITLELGTPFSNLNLEEGDQK